MAKKKRNNKRRHNDSNQSEISNHEDFLSTVPEKEGEDWVGNPLQDAMEETMTFTEESDQNIEHESDENISNSEPFHFSDSSTREEVINEVADTPTEQEKGSDKPFVQVADEIYDHHVDQHHESSVPKSESIGAFFMTQREARNINLKSISQSTKISLTNLELLESDDLERLPNKAYVVGYVKSYARLLGLQTNVCLDLLERTYNALGADIQEPEIVIPQAQNSPQINKKFPMGRVVAIAAMVVIVVAIAGVFITRNSGEPDIVEEDNYQKEIEEEKAKEEIKPVSLSAETPLKENLPEGEVIETTEATDGEQGDSPLDPDVSTDDSTELTSDLNDTNKEEEEEEEEEEEKEEEEKVAKEEEKDDEPKFYPLSKSLYSFDSSMEQDEINALITNEFKVAPVEGIQSVLIKAIEGDSWLTYKSDEDPIKKFVLKKGRSLLFRAKEARVFLGNVSAVKIFLDNKPLNISSRTGVKSLVFPQENADKYVMPLFVFKKDGTVVTSKEWIEENEEVETNL